MSEQEPRRAAQTDRIQMLEDEAQQLPSRRNRAWRRFRRNRLAVVSSVFLFVMILSVFPLAPLLTTIHPHRIDLVEVGRPPGAGHMLGTDLTGRDVWSRLVYGGRASLAVGLVAVVIYMSIGITVGSLSGFYGGAVDAVLMRLTDAIQSFPTTIFLLVVVALIGPGLVNGMLAIGGVGWAGVARLVRSQILSVRERDYVMAARGLGVPQRRIIVRHVLPNILAPITVAASFGVAGAIMTEAGLSFLGLGVQVPTPSWGNMLNEAQSIQIIEAYPWLWVPPGLAVSLCVLAINFIGDGLRDALDPQMSLD